jgi:hypothetical protein
MHQMSKVSPSGVVCSLYPSNDFTSIILPSSSRKALLIFR